MIKGKGLALLVLVVTGFLLQAPVVASETRSGGGDKVPERKPALGAPDAPVTIIEFSDFQCSFCGKFWRETLPRLKETYIKEGRVRFVYRHLAILGKSSVQAALAAECAGEQGKFWAYHDKLFSNQGPLAFTKTRLKQYARELDLDTDAFKKCLDSGKYIKQVEAETELGVFLGARATPTFFINGRMLIGAHPFKTFEMVIRELEGKSPSP